MAITTPEPHLQQTTITTNPTTQRLSLSDMSCAVVIIVIVVVTVVVGVLYLVFSIQYKV